MSEPSSGAVQATDVGEPESADLALAPPPLAEPVRARVVSLAGDVLAALPAEEVPPALRQFARWEPRRRARLAGPALAAALETDPVLRQKVAAAAARSAPGLGEALAAGVVPAAADPVDVAASSYLLRQPGWRAVLAAAQEQLADVDVVRRAAQAGAERDRLAAELERVRARAAQELAEATAAASRDRAEVQHLRAEVNRAREAARAAAAQVAAARDDADAEVAAAAEEVRSATAERRLLRSRVSELERALEQARRAGQSGRTEATLRTRLLLDTLVEAAGGLRRELGLAPAHGRPADAVAAEVAVRPAGPGVVDVAVRGHGPASVEVLDQLLALPRVHLVVDGYNVTKGGYGTLTLEEQRRRLVSALAGLVATTGAEVTCVFDGADVGQVPSLAAPRGVRVLFSLPGMSADELIRRLVRAEPEGRPVVVVSSDREVADGVREAGARPVPSATLLERLARS